MTCSTRQPAKTIRRELGCQPLQVDGGGGRPRRHYGARGAGAWSRRRDRRCRRLPGLDQLQRGGADSHRVAQLEQLAAVHSVAVHERAVGRPEVLDHEPSVGVASNPGVAAGQLAVVAQLPVAAPLSAEDELVAQREPAARRAAGADHQLGDRSGAGAGGSGTAPELSVT